MHTRIHRPRRSSSTLVILGLLVALACPAIAPAQAPDQPKSKRQATDVGKLLDRLDELRRKAGEDEWSMVMRDLILLGPKAVPELIVEMDATHDDFMRRCLGFVFRGIGDKRAVPCLIRALPKTCVKPGSDMGYLAKDAKLMKFMQEHDGQGKVGGPHWSFGRSVNEVRTTLQKLTGSTHGEDEIVHVFLQGSPRQKYLQRTLYQRCAERWASWWKLHAKELVDDPQYADVKLPPLAVPASLAKAFPQGPGVEIDGRHSNHLLESVRDPKAKRVFIDLDTGRMGRLPEFLRAPAGKEERLDDIVAWAAREGYDMMGTLYTPPGSMKPHYVLRGLGLTLWQIETAAWKTLDDDIHASKPLNMGLRTEGILARFDSLKGRYVPEETATFLFQTREGGYGAIFVGVEVHDDSLKPGGAPMLQDDLELNPIASNKGRRYAFTMISEPEEREKPKKP
ncbi:hypothetical protein BH10PLA2_BH10PLA2_03280 [soil metagenome]